MGINVYRVTEDDDVLEAILDPRSLLAPLLASEQVDGICLRFVDPYGNTTFNQIQLADIVKEIQAAVDRSLDEEVKAHARKILRLAEKAIGKPHIYVKFIGD